MKMRVYVETTIFSFLTARPSRDILAAAWQSVTAEWWEKRRNDFDLYSSEVVEAEASVGDPDAAARRIAAMESIPYLQITGDAESLAERFIEPGPLPRKASGDALHLALATIHKMDFLLTWNCKHLDNAQIKPKIRKILADLNYAMPEICTPQELLGEENYEE